MDQRDKDKQVLITSPRYKDKLIKAFQDVGSNIVYSMSDKVVLTIPTVDEELPFFSQSRDWFKSKGVAVLVSSPYTIDICRDKAEFYRFCRRHEFNVPETAQFNAIVKPRFGKGGKGQLRIDRSMISQEIVEWPEYSADYFKWKDKLSIVIRKRCDIVNGESTRAELVEDRFLYSMLSRLGEELQLEGHNVIQFFWNGKDYKLIEVNPRFGGGSWLSFSIFNSPKWLLENL